MLRAVQDCRSVKRRAEGSRTLKITVTRQAENLRSMKMAVTRQAEQYPILPDTEFLLQQLLLSKTDLVLIGHLRVDV